MMPEILNIIHLEDDLNDVELVKEVLANANIKFNIEVTEDEEQFKSLLKSGKYDIVLSDYSLETYDGLVALEYVKNHYPTMPFILVSGSIEEDAGIESLLHGASDYVTKRKLSRLIPAIEKSLKLAEEQRIRAEAEKALQESQESLSLAQKVGNIGSWDYNISQNTLHWSEQTFIQFGLRPGEIEPSNELFQKFIHPDFKDKINEAVKKTFENNQPYSVDAKMLRADGSEWYMHSQGDVIRDEKGNPVRFIGIQQDITQRKEFEKALQQSENKYKSLFEANLAGVYKSTIKGKILECNAAFAKMFGYSSIEEVLNTNAELFYPDKKARLEYISKLKQNGKLFNQEVQILKKDRSHIWITENVVLIDENTMLGTVIDITQSKKLTEELIVAKERAEKADKLKSEFLAQMSHEIRTPINSILNSISMIKAENKSQLSEEEEYCYKAISRASSRLIRTIELILNMSELQLGTYEPKPKNINLETEVIQPLYHEFNILSEKKGLKLAYSVNTKTPTIFGDEYSLTQIFTNLIDNAIKYTPKGSVEIIIYENKKGNVCVDVADTGIGIDEDYLPQLFEPFSQEHHGYTRRYEGNGLGLAIVKGYCKLNNALISVKSKKHKGTTFTVTFR